MGGHYLLLDFFYIYIYIINIYTFENKNHNHQVGIFLFSWDLNQQKPVQKTLLKLSKLHVYKSEHCT